MNKSILLSMAAMMSMNAQEEQKPGIFKRFTAHMSNNTNAFQTIDDMMKRIPTDTYYAIGAMSIMMICGYIGIKIFSDNQSKAAHAKQEVENTQVAFLQGIQRDISSFCSVRRRTVSEIDYWSFKLDTYLTDYDVNIMIDRMQSILVSNPSAIIICPYNTLVITNINDRDLSRPESLLQMLSDTDSKHGLIYNKNYWEKPVLMNGTTKDLMCMYHFATINTQKSIVLTIMKDFTRISESDIEETMELLYYNYRHYKVIHPKSNTTNLMHCIDCINPRIFLECVRELSDNKTDQKSDLVRISHEDSDVNIAALKMNASIDRKIYWFLLDLSSGDYSCFTADYWL